MKKPLLIAISLCLITTAQAQVAETDTIAKEAISKLSFIVGDWSGTGWMMDREGQRHTFTQTEHIQFKLDTTALLIEGIGKEEDRIIHNALAIVTWNKADSMYDLRSYLSTGRGGDFKAELKEGRFHWYPNDKMRYIIALNDKGQWHETGEMQRENDWFQFFEMTLDKKEKK